jgi:hypothetical protein
MVVGKVGLSILPMKSAVAIGGEFDQARKGLTCQASWYLEVPHVPKILTKVLHCPALLAL